MMAFRFLALTAAPLAAIAASHDRHPLSYAPMPNDAYKPPVADEVTTLLDLVSSRPELSTLTSLLQDIPGFAKAFDTPPTWQFTFFAPSNAAFNQTGQYYKSFVTTPKGKWWLGNILQHHYIPNSKLRSNVFNSTNMRFQTGSYLYIGSQDLSQTYFNNASAVTEPDIDITNGIVHIVDHILDPSAQIFNEDLPKGPQGFIAGSCANTDLPYCYKSVP